MERRLNFARDSMMSFSRPVPPLDVTHSSRSQASTLKLVLPLVAGLSLLLGGTAPAACAQWAVVRRNVNLRPQPSTDSAATMLLQAGTELELVWPDRVNRYYLVLTEAGEIGWAWGSNVRLVPESEVPSLEHFPRGRGTRPAV